MLNIRHVQYAPLDASYEAQQRRTNGGDVGGGNDNRAREKDPEEGESFIAGTMEIGDVRIPCTRNCRRIMVVTLGTLLLSLIVLVVGLSHRRYQGIDEAKGRQESIDDIVNKKLKEGDGDDKKKTEDDAELDKIVDDGKSFANAHLSDENFPKNPFPRSGPGGNYHNNGTFIDDKSEGTRNGTACFPASVCYQRRHFIGDPSKLADTKAFMVLASFPGECVCEGERNS